VGRLGPRGVHGDGEEAAPVRDIDADDGDRDEWERESRVTGAAIATFTGQIVELLAPDPATIVIEDIAHHLAAVNRFVGATRQPYSVAQHAVLVSYCCEPEDALHGLLHDAAEAYLGEMVRPLKQLAVMAPYRAMEAQLQVVIYGKFGLPLATPWSVTRMDERLAGTEAQDLFLPHAIPGWARQMERLPLGGVPIEAWPPCCAEDVFLRRFRELTSGGID
jgi:hypothetical protein